MIPRPPPPTLFPYTTLFRSAAQLPFRECLINDNWREQRMASISIARNHPDGRVAFAAFCVDLGCLGIKSAFAHPDRKSTRLNPSHITISYAVFCLKKKRYNK